MKQKTAYRREWLLLAALALLAGLTLWAAGRERARLPGNVARPLTGAEQAEVVARNSPLTEYIYLSPHADFPREGQVRKITVHHMAGDLTLERVGRVFSDGDRMASANYGIDSEGRIGLYVEEGNRSWASGSPDNDHQAVTIEVANCATGGDWPVSGAAYEALIQLCADICRRNGIEELRYTGDGTGSLTVHSMFADTQCPGPYLTGRMADIAEEVNRRLAAGEYDGK